MINLQNEQDGGALPQEKNSEQMFYNSEENGRRTGESLRFPSDVTAEELRAAEEYLASYRHGARMLECMRYGRHYMGSEVLPDDPLLRMSEDMADFECLTGDVDETIITARMFGVRQFIESLRCDSNSRLLLYWHYIRGVSVTRCAEMLDISRAGAFRVRRRALTAAARALRRMNNLMK